MRAGTVIRFKGLGLVAVLGAALAAAPGACRAQTALEQLEAMAGGSGPPRAGADEALKAESGVLFGESGRENGSAPVSLGGPPPGALGTARAGAARPAGPEEPASRRIGRLKRALSVLPAGQYLLAKEKGRSDEDLKWFKRLEPFRAAFLVLAAAGAAIGDPLSIGINLIAYALSSLPANIDPPNIEGSQADALDFNRGVRAVLSSPRVMTYVALEFLANNIAAFGGPSMMYAETSSYTNVDYLTHFLGGVAVGKILDLFYDASGAARLFAARVREKIRRMGDDSILAKPVKELLKEVSVHPRFTLVLASFAAIGPFWEGLEWSGSYLFRSSSTAVAALKESVGNWTRDMVMNALGGIASYLVPSSGQEAAPAPAGAR